MKERERKTGRNRMKHWERDRQVETECEKEIDGSRLSCHALEKEKNEVTLIGREHEAKVQTHTARDTLGQRARDTLG